MSTNKIDPKQVYNGLLEYRAKHDAQRGSTSDTPDNSVLILLGFLLAILPTIVIAAIYDKHQKLKSTEILYSNCIEHHKPSECIHIINERKIEWN